MSLPTHVTLSSAELYCRTISTIRLTTKDLVHALTSDDMPPRRPASINHSV